MLAYVTQICIEGKSMRSFWDSLHEVEVMLPFEFEISCAGLWPECISPAGGTIWGKLWDLEGSQPSSWKEATKACFWKLELDLGASSSFWCLLCCDVNIHHHTLPPMWAVLITMPCPPRWAENHSQNQPFWCPATASMASPFNGKKWELSGMLPLYNLPIWFLQYTHRFNLMVNLI